MRKQHESVNHTGKKSYHQNSYSRGIYRSRGYTRPIFQQESQIGRSRTADFNAQFQSPYRRAKTQPLYGVSGSFSRKQAKTERLLSSGTGTGRKYSYKNDSYSRARNRSGASAPRAAAASTRSGSLRVVFIIFMALTAIFFARLIYLQIIVSDHYTALAEETRTISFETTPKRGTIYDRNGSILAISVDATTIYCNPSEVSDSRSTARSIAKVLGGKVTDYLDLLESTSSTFVYIKRQADTDVADRLKKLDLDGIYFIADSKREYPNGAVGGQVIGICDVDGNGITGLELQYDDILKGTPGKYSAERGENGAPIPGGVIEDTPAQDGEDIMISLDIRLQDSVEQALSKRIEELGTSAGSSVVMDSETGEIYAICSVPYLDPNNLDESEAGSENLTCVSTLFEPGSIFKTLSSLAVLESGVYEPDSQIYCPSKIWANGYSISDVTKRGDVTYTLSDILAYSSNVGMSLAVEAAGFDKLADVIERFGITELTGIDYPGEAQGTVDDVSTWAKIKGYNVSFGQGISTSVISMVRAYAAIENDGVMVTPHFLISRIQSDAIEEYDSKVVCTDQDAIDKLKEMLHGVVTYGSGKSAQIEGFKVCGKTSTAEVAMNGSYDSGLLNLSFVGFLDDSTSSLVCYAGANNVFSRGSVAGVFAEIMQDAIELYNIASLSEDE